MKYLNNGTETDLINCVKTFMKDDQDFVKLYIVESLVVLGQVLSPQVTLKIVIIVPQHFHHYRSMLIM